MNLLGLEKGQVRSSQAEYNLVMAECPMSHPYRKVGELSDTYCPMSKRFSWNESYYGGKGNRYFFIDNTKFKLTDDEVSKCTEWDYKFQTIPGAYAAEAKKILNFICDNVTKFADGFLFELINRSTSKYEFTKCINAELKKSSTYTCKNITKFLEHLDVEKYFSGKFYREFSSDVKKPDNYPSTTNWNGKFYGGYDKYIYIDGEKETIDMVDYAKFMRYDDAVCITSRHKIAYFDKLSDITGRVRIHNGCYVMIKEDK